MLQSANPYKHIESNIDVHIRLEMLRIVVAKNLKLKVHITNTSNIASTVAALSSAFRHDYSLIMGEDLARSLPSWKDYEKLKSFQIISVERTGNISSEQIRSSISAQKPVDKLLDIGVAHYILQNRLYQ